MSMKISKDTSWNRTSDLPISSTVLQRWIHIRTFVYFVRVDSITESRVPLHYVDVNSANTVYSCCHSVDGLLQAVYLWHRVFELQDLRLSDCENPHCGILGCDVVIRTHNRSKRTVKSHTSNSAATGIDTIHVYIYIYIHTQKFRC